MKNKNGFLLAEETLKIIIAVICLVVLAYLIYSIYFTNISGTKLKQAQEVLTGSEQSLEKSMNRVLSTGTSETFPVSSPSSWYFFSFIEGEKPNSCGGKNCLCICDKVLNFNSEKRQISECGENGVCIQFEQLEKFEPIQIKKSTEGLTTLNIENFGGKIKLS